MSEDQLVQIPLGGGLDETNEDAEVPADKMRQCDNVVFPDGNTCQKRPGVTQIASRANLQRLAKRGDELLATDGQQLYAYNAKLGALVARGRVSPCMASRSLLASANWKAAGVGVYPNVGLTPMASFAEDPVTLLQVRAFSDGRSVGVRVVDPATETILLSTYLSNDAGDLTGNGVNQPRVIIIASRAFVLYWDQANAATCRYQSIDLTNVAAGFTAVAALPGVALSATAFWDAKPVTGSQSVAVFVVKSTTAVLTYLAYSGATLSLTFGPTTIETVGGSPTFTACATFATSLDGVVVTYAYSTTAAGVQTNSVRWAAYDNALVPVRTPVTIIVDTYTPASEATEPGNVQAMGIVQTGENLGTNTAGYAITLSRRYQIGLPAPTNPLAGSANAPSVLPAFYVAHVFKNQAAGVRQTYGPHIGFQTMSKPFALTIAGAVAMYCLVQFSDGLRVSSSAPPLSGTSPTLVLVQLSDAAQNALTIQKPCAVLAPTFAGLSPPAAMDPCVRTGTGLLAVSCPGTEEDEAGATSASSLSLDWQSPGLWQSVELGDWAWLAGGMPIIYDGRTTTEVHFIHPPPKAVAYADSATVTGGAVITTYNAVQYITRYVQQDDNGNLHFSQPSQPSDPSDCSALTGADKILVNCGSCRMTLRSDVTIGGSGGPGAHPVLIEVYRNSAITPDVWQLVGTVPSDVSSPVVTFTDTTPEPFTGIGQPFLYTTGGDVASTAAPNLSALTVHANRVIGVDEDGRTAWFTSELVAAECPRASNVFTLQWAKGPITAQWSLETRLHGATKDSVAYLLGQGPSITNVGVDWTQPQGWQDDLGVEDPRGVSSFGGGMILATSRGVYVEGRDGAFTWIGQRFRRTLAAAPVVTSIAPLVDDGAVRISLAAADGVDVAGATIHWDYRYDRISRHLLSGGSPAVVSSIVAGGTWYGLELVTVSGVVTGKIIAESSSSSLDDGVYVVEVLVTGWAAIGGMQGSTRLHRVQLLAASQSAHGLKIETARDYSASFDADSSTWTSAEIGAMTIEQVRHTPYTQKAMAVSARITDVAPSGALGTGVGPLYRSLLLRIQPRRGENKNLTTTQQR